MELKILILDDEYIILDGLCSFPWEMYGCRIVGKAMDGEEGMELIISEKDQKWGGFKDTFKF